MTLFRDLLHRHTHLTEEEQKKAGLAIGAAMKKEHEAFLKVLIALLDGKEIDTTNPTSFLKKDEYEKVHDEGKRKIDVALLNIADQIRIIENFYRSKHTPNESPHLETMIEHLWLMKERLEKEYDDIFKF